MKKLKIIHTNVPTHRKIDLISFYNEFVDYYPNCELETKEWFVNNIKDGWIILDCGANIGYFSILFSRLSPNGIIHSFEPTSTYNMLIENLRYNKTENVIAHKLAMGKKTGNFTEKLFRIWGNKAENDLFQFITIDDFISTNSITQCNCIKIDVDSFDFEVLQGADETLRRFNPFVVVELNHALSQRGQNNMEALNWLSKKGYNNFLVLDFDNFIFKKGYNFDGEKTEIKLFFKKTD